MHQGATANTIEELAKKLDGVNAGAVRQDHRRNTTRPCAPTLPFNPNIKDGRRTEGLAVPKIELGEHDRQAAVRGLCGDLRRHLHLRRLAHHHRRRRCSNTDYQPIRGLYAAGELVGGHLLFQLSGRHRSDRRARCSAESPARPPPEPREADGEDNASTKLSACDIAQGVATGAFSAEAVVRDCLDRIEERDKARSRPGRLSTASSLLGTGARSVERALNGCARRRAARHARTSSTRSICPPDMGSPIYRRTIARRATRPAWRSLAAPGAVILGKTITCEFAGADAERHTQPTTIWITRPAARRAVRPLPSRTTWSRSPIGTADGRLGVASGFVLRRRSATSRPTISSLAAASNSPPKAATPSV